jgi:hypothetical protein
MLTRLPTLLFTAVLLDACGGESSLGSGRDGRARGGATSVDETAGASGSRDMEAPAGGTAGLVGSAGGGGQAAAGARGGGGSGLAGSGGIAGGAGKASGGAPAVGGSGGSTGKDPLACEPPLVPLLDGPAATRVPSPPLAACAGDFDDDGRLDLATINTDGSIAVLIGNGNGTFQQGDTYDEDALRDATYGLGRIAAADLNHDGVLDLVALDRELSVVKVLFGRGNGRFDTPISFVVGEQPVAVAIADWDRDGSLDLAYADSKGVRILWNHGDGTFAPASDAFDFPEDASDSVEALGAGDFDEDGELDIALATVHGVSVLRGDGAHGFVPTSPTAVISTSGSLAVGDFNHDQHLDVLTMEECARGASPTISVLLGAGDASLATPVPYGTSPCLTTSAFADVNRDGNLDIVADPALAVLGNHTGGFDAWAMATAGTGGSVLALGDWNGDGQLDSAGLSDDLIVIRLGHGDGSFGGVPVLPGFSNVSALALGDLNDDGTLDVAAIAKIWNADNTTSVSLALSFGRGDGTFDVVTSQAAPSGAFPTVHSADLNHDGQTDLVTTGDESSSIRVLMGIGGGNFAAPHEVGVAGPVWAASIADLNGDGLLDVVSAAQSPWSLSLLFGVGDGSFTQHADLPLDHNPSRFAPGDVNGDGITDLVVGGYNDAVVSVLLGEGGGGFAAPEDYPIEQYSAAIALGDLNGDGAVDIVSANYYSMSILYGHGDATFLASNDYALSVQDLALADFNADGHLDIVLGGSPPRIMFGQGDGTFPCSAFYGLGHYSQLVAVGDLNHDGRLDLVASMASVDGLNVFLNAPR